MITLWILDLEETSTYNGTIQERQDSRLEQAGTDRIHSWTNRNWTEYTAGQQELNRIHGWTTGSGQNTQPYKQELAEGHSAETTAFERPEQTHRPSGAEPEPNGYSSLLKLLQQEPKPAKLLRFSGGLQQS